MSIKKTSMSHKGNTLLLMALPIHELTSNIYMLVLESTPIVEAIIIGRSETSPTAWMSRFTNNEISYTKSIIAQKSEDKQLFNCANPEQPCRTRPKN